MQVKTTLYKQSNKDAIQQWKVFVTDNKITVEYGQVNGKLQSKDTLCFGKNVGKTNATTDKEQALLEATAKWEKQVKKGYVECPSGKRVINLPMKVESYFKGKMKDKVVFPATIGRKLNGINVECRLLPDGTFVQLSRGGDQYPLPAPIAKQELIDLMKALQVTSFNYEAYLHGYHLQDIVGAVKAPHKHKELWEKLEYHIFDIPSSSEVWSKRNALLRKGQKSKKTKYVKFVENITVNDHKEIQAYHNKVVLEGYEGAIVRNLSGIYEYNKRTMDVLKVKSVLCDEFKVLSYEIDKNHQPVFTCLSAGGEFKVKPKGTKERRQQILAEADSWVGNWLTVEYEMFSKDNIPLKPVGIDLREGHLINGVFTPTE